MDWIIYAGNENELVFFAVHFFLLHFYYISRQKKNKLCSHFLFSSSLSASSSSSSTCVSQLLSVTKAFCDCKQSGYVISLLLSSMNLKRQRKRLDLILWRHVPNHTDTSDHKMIVRQSAKRKEIALPDNWQTSSFMWSDNVFCTIAFRFIVKILKTAKVKIMEHVRHLIYVLSCVLFC